MAKYFLGSVGSVEAFKKKEGSNEYELAFVSKTLTDSGITPPIIPPSLFSPPQNLIT